MKRMSNENKTFPHILLDCNEQLSCQLSIGRRSSSSSSSAVLLLLQSCLTAVGTDEHVWQRPVAARRTTAIRCIKKERYGGRLFLVPLSEFCGDGQRYATGCSTMCHRPWSFSFLAIHTHGVRWRLQLLAVGTQLRWGVLFTSLYLWCWSSVAGVANQCLLKMS